MSDFQTRALDIVNHFAQIVPELIDDVSQKGAYVYAEDPDQNRYVEVDYYYFSEHLPGIKLGEKITFEQVVEAILLTANITDASEDFKNAIYSEVENSFGIQYQLAVNYLETAKTQIKQINEEAGKEILNPWVLDTMLAGATDFYESSRCW